MRIEINWRRFINWLLDFDISYGLACMGISIMNCVLIRHINLSLTESFIEALSLGFALPYLIKKG